MLDTRSYIPALHAIDVSCCHLSCKIRIFRKIFKVSSTQRTSLDIYCRSKQHAQVLCLTFFSKDFSHLTDQIYIKAARCCTGCRKTNCFHTLIQSKVVCFPFLLPNSVRTIRHHHAWNSEPFHSLCIPEICPRTHPGFFFQCHGRYQLLQVTFHCFSSIPFSDESMLANFKSYFCYNFLFSITFSFSIFIFINL